jgi:hypothetical protein
MWQVLLGAGIITTNIAAITLAFENLLVCKGRQYCEWGFHGAKEACDLVWKERLF